MVMFERLDWGTHRDVLLYAVPARECFSGHEQNPKNIVDAISASSASAFAWAFARNLVADCCIFTRWVPYLDAAYYGEDSQMITELTRRYDLTDETVREKLTRSLTMILAGREWMELNLPMNSKAPSVRALRRGIRRRHPGHKLADVIGEKGVNMITQRAQSNDATEFLRELRRWS